MEGYKKLIFEQYQVRKTKKQKQAFSNWLHETLSSWGYELKEEAYSKKGTNLIVGDIEAAELVFTAHYDTQPNFIFPMVMGFSNWISFIISQLLVLIPLFLIPAIYITISVLLSADGSFNIFPIMIMLVLFSMQMLCGFANKHTANDNTSGVITLLSVLKAMPQDKREKVCVVFFDQEELGLIGSAKFSKKYKKQMQNKPLINFDCVSDGKTISIVTKKAFRNSKYNFILETSCEKVIKDSPKKLRFATAFSNIYMSDQLNFPQGVGVVASHKAPLFGYYLSRIHTMWDTKFDNENIELLTNMMVEMVNTI